MPLAYLGLGSNLGDREGTLSSARDALSTAFPGARFSPLYETEPVGLKGQPWFLNQAAEIDTFLPPEGLLEWVHGLENALGRRRTVPQGPRTLDLDILLYGDAVLEEPSLRVPHPGLMRRRFVLLPLSDLAPALRVPGEGLTVSEALEKLEDPSSVRPFMGGSATC